MGRKHRLRRLMVGDTAWLWSVRHRHAGGRCRETLSLHREGARSTLRLVFLAAPGRFTESGFVGDLHLDGVLNLQEPGVVRRLLDEALARDLFPTPPGQRELDGWPLFEAVLPLFPREAPAP